MANLLTKQSQGTTESTTAPVCTAVAMAVEDIPDTKLLPLLALQVCVCFTMHENMYDKFTVNFNSLNHRETETERRPRMREREKKRGY